MATSEQQIHSENDETQSDNDSYDTEHSQEDPAFDILEETKSRLSKLSVKEKSKSRKVDDEIEVDLDVAEVAGSQLDGSYEMIQKIIYDGQVEKLKVDQCKIYLKKHGLRLSGTKEILIHRIKEHLDILNGCGEEKYAASSYILNCKGDACMGDIVMFEQNVYEQFNIASRSANGPPCGTRTVVGRIVKESYGAAKQQHTFTIEVLWSKGEKPLPPLHPLLIKGRNLYRLKTMRQKWDDEEKRRKMLLEKHARGSFARSQREARIQEKEMRSMLKVNRVSGMGHQNRKQEGNQRLPVLIKSENRNVVFSPLPSNPETLASLPRKLEQEEIRTKQNFEQKEYKSQISKENGPILPESINRKLNFLPSVNVPQERIHQRQPLIWMNQNPSTSSFRVEPYQQTHGQNMNFHLSKRPHQGDIQDGQSMHRIPLMSASTNSFQSHINENDLKFYPRNIPLQWPVQKESMHLNPQDACEKNMRFNQARSPLKKMGNERKQFCRYYAQGRCYFGGSC